MDNLHKYIETEQQTGYITCMDVDTRWYMLIYMLSA